MKTKVKLTICCGLYAAYQLINLIMTAQVKIVEMRQIFGVLLSIIALFLFCVSSKKNKFFSKVSILGYVIGAILAIDTTNISLKATMFEQSATYAGTLYLYNYFLENVILNVLFLALGFCMFRNFKDHSPLITMFVVFVIALIATSLYQVLTNGNIGMMAFRILCYYLPLLAIPCLVLIREEKAFAFQSERVETTRSYKPVFTYAQASYKVKNIEKRNRLAQDLS